MLRQQWRYRTTPAVPEGASLVEENLLRTHNEVNTAGINTITFPENKWQSLIEGAFQNFPFWGRVKITRWSFKHYSINIDWGWIKSYPDIKSTISLSNVKSSIIFSDKSNLRPSADNHFNRIYQQQFLLTWYGSS